MKHFHRLGFLLEAATRLYCRRFQTLAQDLDLSWNQCRAITCVARSQGLTQTALAELAEIDPTTLGRMLDRMEQQGWVERRADPMDRRVHALTITNTGKQLTDQMPHFLEMTSEEALRGLSNGQRRLLLSLLAQVRANLLDGAGRLPPQRYRPAEDLNPALWAAYGRRRD